MPAVRNLFDNRKKFTVESFLWDSKRAIMIKEGKKDTFVYELGKMDKSLRNRDHWSYNIVLGFDRFIKAKCPLCGG